MDQTGLMHTDDKLIIGITGGAGAGKSTIVSFVCSHFDADFMHCDIIAHELMEPGKANYNALLKEYGDGILTGDYGSDIDRRKLTEAVGKSISGYKRLNEITHPGVINEVNKRIAASHKKIILVEAALLIEAGMTKMCDDVWYVYADINERRERVKKNRGWDEKKTDATIKNQLSHDEFLKNTTYMIENHDFSDEADIKACERVRYLLELKGIKETYK